MVSSLAPEGLTVMFGKCAVFALALGALLPVGLTPAAGAETPTTPLLAYSHGLCVSGPNVGTPGFGSASIQVEDRGLILAEVHLRHATPNHRYTLELVQTPSGDGCQVASATLKTNREGEGETVVRTTRLAGTTGVFVMINDSDSFGYITTRNTLLPVRKPRD
jgi:hypothetical protein